MKARGHLDLLQAFFDIAFASRACRLEWTDVDRFSDTRTLFRKHADQDWSFTDCVSFLVMKQRRLLEVLTKDLHFEEAGFIALLK